MQASSPMQTGRLSDLARHLVLPDGLAKTGYPAIERHISAMGITFDVWQADLCRATLGKRSSGKYAATVGGVVWSLPRQVGKTFTVGALLFALCVEIPGLLVLWTAHHTRTSGETFRSMQGFAKRAKVRPFVEHVYTGAGTESVVFRNGSRILFGARDQGFGLGFAAVDVIVFDEAQRLRDQTRMDMIPAANRAKNPSGALIFYIGTPPRPNDEGEAFRSLRDDAIAGSDKDTFYVEFSADPDASPDDREQWRKANPSYPVHTPVESMLRMRKHLGSDEAWAREALGIWDRVQTNGAIPMDAWADRADQSSQIATGHTLGVEVGPDMAWASVSLAGLRADGKRHIELVENRNGANWLPAYVAEVLALNPSIRGVVGDVGGPLAALVTAKGKNRYILAGPDIEITPLRVSELAVACSQVVDGVSTGWLIHIDQPQLTSAAAGAGKRALQDSGLWVFHRKLSSGDITPIQAATYALWGAMSGKVRTPNRVSRTKGRVVVLA